MSFFELLTNRFDELIGVVGVRCVGEDVLLGVKTVSVFVPAKNVDCISADTQSRPGRQSRSTGNGCISLVGMLILPLVDAVDSWGNRYLV